MEQLTPTELEALLKVLRDAGVSSAVVPTTRGTLQVVLAPSFDPMPGAEPEPGGWKSPKNLDAEFEVP